MIGELEPTPTKPPGKLRRASNHVPGGSPSLAALSAAIALYVLAEVGAPGWVLIVLSVIALVLAILAGFRFRDERAERRALDALPPPVLPTAGGALTTNELAVSRRRKRLALAEETDQLSAELIRLTQFWPPRLEDRDQQRLARTEADMLEEYHAKHRARLIPLFEQLVQEGVILRPDHTRQFFERPEHPGIVQGMPGVLDEAAERLRLTDLDLAAWLNEQIPEFKSLAADLREQGQRPVPVLQRLDVIHEEFRGLNSKVAQRLRRNAKVWLDYWTQNPDGYNAYVMRSGGDDLLEEADVYDYTADQLVFLRDQVG